MLKTASFPKVVEMNSRDLFFKCQVTIKIYRKYFKISLYIYTLHLQKTDFRKNFQIVTLPYIVLTLLNIE